jgi:hypothetical protein
MQMESAYKDIYLLPMATVSRVTELGVLATILVLPVINLMTDVIDWGD